MKIISCIYEDDKISYMIADKKETREIELLQGLRMFDFKTDDRNKAILECVELMKNNNCEFMIYEDDFEIRYIDVNSKEIEMINDELKNKAYDDLVEIVNELRKYYDIDKIKTYTVYVWTKRDVNGFGENVFDILSDEIFMYDEEHVIIEESLPIIEKIQKKLIEIEKLKEY